jgi:hypothetical protein
MNEAGETSKRHLPTPEEIRYPDEASSRMVLSLMLISLPQSPQLPSVYHH